MPGLDVLTDYRVMNVPVGGGVVIAGGFAVADGAGGLARKFLGGPLGAAAVPVGQLAIAWLLRFPTVARFIGESTSEILSAVQVASAADALMGIRAAVRRGLTAVGVPALGAGTAAAIGQAPRATAAPQVFRSVVHQKAALTRL